MQDVRHLSLLLAVLSRAALDAATGKMCTSKERRAARAWVSDWKPCTNPEPYSFLWVCEHLDLDPYHTRNVILKLSKSVQSQVTLGGRSNNATRSAEAIFDLVCDGSGYPITDINPQRKTNHYSTT